MNNPNINSLGLPNNPSPVPTPIPNPFLPQNNYAPTMGAQTPFYSQPILQPAGMVYLINSSQELNTIPTNAGLTLYWCDNENKVYIRNLAGGSIQTKEFYLSTTPNNSQNGLVGASGDDSIPEETLEKINTRLANIESKLKSLKGGEPEWQL
jgi:hypothetical protein